MRDLKKKRLLARGWKLGNAAEFLGLTVQEELLVAVRLQLAQSLRRRRESKQLTQQQLAKAMGSSQSRVAKMEAGDPSVALDLLVRSLLALGVTPRALGKTIAGTKPSRAA
jgi:DNA-binding XRE family transcriptional regulator